MEPLNTFAVLAGSSLGLILGKRVPDRVVRFLLEIIRIIYDRAGSLNGVAGWEAYTSPLLADPSASTGGLVLQNKLGEY